MTDVAGDGVLGPSGTINISGTLASAGSEALLLDDGNTITALGTITGLYKLELGHTSGTVSVPACTTPRLFCNSGGTTQATADLTITTELEVASGTTFNANGNTINTAEVDVNGGTLNLSNSTLNFATAGQEWNMTAASTLTAQNSTCTGYSAANPTLMKLPDTGEDESTSDFQIIGNIKNFKAMGDTDITVLGTVTDCVVDGSEANIYQWHHTLDTAQLLDADAESDDDIKLPKPSLDNATELQTGG